MREKREEERDICYDTALHNLSWLNIIYIDSVGVEPTKNSKKCYVKMGENHRHDINVIRFVLGVNIVSYWRSNMSPMPQCYVKRNMVPMNLRIHRTLSIAL